MKVAVHLSFNGKAEEAAVFYRSILGGEISAIIRNKDISPDEYKADELAGKKIMNLDYEVKDSLISMCDVKPGSEVNYGKNGITLQLSFTHIDEIKEVFHKLSHGGKILHPLEPASWSNLFGILTDKFGITWILFME